MRCAENGNGASEHGFLLLEALIALTILSFALAALLGMFSSALGGVKKTESHTQALVLARSLLADQTSGRHFVPSKITGTYEKLSWEVQIELRDEVNGLASTPWQLYRISVTVLSERNRQVQLSTLRLGDRREKSNQSRF